MKTTFIKTLFIVLLITAFSAGEFFVFVFRISAEESGEFQIDSAVSQDQISPLQIPEESSGDLSAADNQLFMEPQLDTDKNGNDFSGAAEGMSYERERERERERRMRADLYHNPMARFWIR